MGDKNYGVNTVANPVHESSGGMLPSFSNPAGGQCADNIDRVLGYLLAYDGQGVPTSKVPVGDVAAQGSSGSKYWMMYLDLNNIPEGRYLFLAEFKLSGGTINERIDRFFRRGNPS